MTTLEDVARLAGVSIATVSYVLNNSKKVKQETKLKVMAAVEQLNYIPNSSARKMRESNSREISVVFPHIDDPYYSEILQGIIQQADEEGYTVNVAFSYNHPKKERKIIHDFIGRNPSGLMIVTCQPDSAAFFENSIIRYHIPSVFIDRMPKGLDLNFIAFDNYATIYSLTEHLLESGYEDISLFTGPSGLLGEHDCISAFQDAHAAKGIACDQNLMHTCDMTKEDSFRIQMESSKNRIPQAVISSSETITIGITEALALCHLSIPEDILVITLGIECWHSSDYHAGALRTARRAFTLGREAVDLLLKNIRKPAFFEKQFILRQDRYLKETYAIPHPPQKHFCVAKKKALRILATPIPTMHALELVSQDFSALHDVEILIDYLDLSDLFAKICADTHKERSEYDIYLFDVSWLSYLVQENCFQDLTSFICSSGFDTTHIMEKNLANTNFKGRYFGLPIIGGTHLLFYRKDLFENIQLQRAFQAQHQLPLRPPKFWTEFNGIAKFFTREYNPDSPTTYGTAISGGLREEMFLELIVRLWSYGGGLYDMNNRLILNSPANYKGFQSILETCRYSPENPFSQKHEVSFSQFANNEIAMLLSFTEYSSLLKKLLPESAGKIGYSTIPGKAPANVGWHLGVSPATQNYELILNYFQWICQKNISYYMTILDGQSVMDYPYHNHELLKLYPWLSSTEEGVALSHSRLYPYQGRSGTVPPYQVESVLYNVFQNLYHHGHSIQDALDLGQKEMLRLFQ